MHRRNIIAVILTVVIFLSATVLGVSAVYRVDEVRLETQTVSAAAEAEAIELRKKILARYKDDSIFFADRTKTEKELAEFPHFRMISFQKSYPDRLVIRLVEDAEIFALKKSESEYLILGLDGTLLSVRDAATNRSDGKDNIVVEGLEADGEKGRIVSSDGLCAPLFAFAEEIDSPLGGIRTNVVKITVRRPIADESSASFLIELTEGVVANISEPSVKTAEKARAFAEKYLKLSDADRLSGQIRVFEDKNGEIQALYSDKL